MSMEQRQSQPPTVSGRQGTLSMALSDWQHVPQQIISQYEPKAEEA